MPMTIVVTRDVPARFRGFLASVMLEIGPGIYTSPRMSAGVRERTWSVLTDWYAAMAGGSIVMTWEDSREQSGQGILVLGTPPIELVDVEGVILSRRSVG